MLWGRDSEVSVFVFFGPDSSCEDWFCVCRVLWQRSVSFGSCSFSERKVLQSGERSHVCSPEMPKMHNRCFTKLIVGQVGPYPTHLGVTMVMSSVATWSYCGTSCLFLYVHVEVPWFLITSILYLGRWGNSVGLLEAQSNNRWGCSSLDKNRPGL